MSANRARIENMNRARMAKVGTPIERFVGMTRKVGECIEWTGRTHRGYGLFWFEGRNVRAHRFSYQFFVGPIPDGLTIDHLCRNTRCVRVAHLEPVTPRENVLPGDTITARLAAQTQCLRGHDLSGPNLRIYRGSRICIACGALSMAAIRAAKRAKSERRCECGCGATVISRFKRGHNNAIATDLSAFAGSEQP